MTSPRAAPSAMRMPISRVRATGRERENSIEAGGGEEQAGHAEAGGDDGAGPLGQQHDRRRPLAA